MSPSAGREEEQARWRANPLDLAHDAILVWSPEGGIESWNRGAEELYGFSALEAVGRRADELLGSVFPRPWRDIEALLERTGRWEGELRHRTKAGEHVTVSAKLQVFRGGTDGSYHVLETNRDITEHKRAEVALRESEQRYSAIFDKAPFAIALTKMPEGITVSVNDAFLKLFNCTREAVVGKSSVDLGISDADSQTRVRAELQQHGSVRDFEVTRRTNSATQHVLSINVDWVSIQGQKFVLTTIQDITERKRAQDQLGSEKERLAVTLRSIGDGVIATDVAARVTVFNSVAEELTGWKGEEAVGRPLHEVFEIVNEDTRRPAPNPVDRVLRDGVVVGLANHTALIARDGTERPIADSGAPIRDASGRMCGVVLVFRDQTEQRRAEHAVRESEKRFRTLFETMSEGFSLNEIICDEAGKPRDLRYLEVNPAFERHTGLKTADIIGRTTLQLFPDAEPSWFERYGKVALTGKPAHFEASFGPLGRWFEVSAYQTEPGRFAVVFFDITERKKAEEALRKAGRIKDDFLSMASHELRTPLSTLRLHAETLGRSLRKAQVADEHVEGKLSRMESQIDRMEALVHTLLDVSRITAGRLVLDLAEFDLADVTKEVIEGFESHAESAGTELRLRTRAVVGRWDRMRLDQVVTNLVSNAIKYGNGQPVEVMLDERDDAAVLVVRDHGIGISPESQERIFERFERGAGVNITSGLGLGLWIARQMVEAHGGKIAVDSTPGAGATFTVTLPRVTP